MKEVLGRESTSDELITPGLTCCLAARALPGR
jgi:hypothetical protein